MDSDNLYMNEDSFKNQAEGFEPFRTCEAEVMQHLAIQVENVIAPILQKYNLYSYIQASNEIADKVFKNTTLWCSLKRNQR